MRVIALDVLQCYCNEVVASDTQQRRRRRRRRRRRHHHHQQQQQQQQQHSLRCGVDPTHPASRHASARDSSPITWGELLASHLTAFRPTLSQTSRPMPSGHTIRMAHRLRTLLHDTEHGAPNLSTAQPSDAVRYNRLRALPVNTLVVVVAAGVTHLQRYGVVSRADAKPLYLQYRSSAVTI